MSGAPHSDEAEQALLGSMLQTREALTEALDRLTPDHFYNPVNRLVFIALAEMYRLEKVIDLVTFTEALQDGLRVEKDHKHPGYLLKIAEVGGAGKLADLFTCVPTAANVAHYVDIVREKYLMRLIIGKCSEIIRVASDEQAQIGQLLEETQGTLTQIIIEAERPDVIRHVAQGLDITIAQLEHAYRHRGQAAIHGLATGLFDLDRMTAGLRPQQLVIVGARPSQGKTALAMNFAANMALDNQIPVGVFSMEMSFQEVVNRLFCSVTDVSLQRFRDGFLKDSDFEKAPENAARIGKAPLWIDDSPSLSIANFKARARLMRTRFGVKAIVVDYLQLMRSTSKRAQDARWLEITEISGALKATAKELEIPIICCAQLNREAESREFGKPKLSDLRESGSIEQDADIVLLLWRPERHLQFKDDRNKLAKVLELKDSEGNELWEKKAKKGDESNELSKDQRQDRDDQIDSFAQLILAKQRNGPVGDIRLRFVPEMTRFENVTAKSWSNREDERQQMDEPF